MSPPLLRVGFVGLGTMGGAMAANVLRAGFPLTVYNRTAARARPLAELGAVIASSPRDVARESEIVITCVTASRDVEQVVLGEVGIVEGVRAGAVLVDTSTIDPAVSRLLAGRLAERGAGALDAPVSGGSEGAERGTLTIFVGGEIRDLERARPVLAAMGRTITHVGPSGAGQLVKALNQVILAGAYQSVAEGLALGLAAGLDMPRVVEALSGGAARSWVLEQRAGRMLDDRYPLGFKVDLYRKDLGIALDAGAALGVPLPVAGLVRELLTALCARGSGGEDVSALMRNLRRLGALDG